MFISLEAYGFCNSGQSYIVQTRQTIVGLRTMAGKKIKLKEEAINEILVADTALESGVEVSDSEDQFDEEEKEDREGEEEEEEGGRRGTGR